jgi:LysM repeat protein
MKFSASLFRSALPLIGLLALSACVPSGPSQLDEEREPHYLAGKRRFNEMDYNGAIEAFTKAVEVNPRSASAHLELACLYESQKAETDPVDAIYHFEQYLKLRPRAPNADVILQRILGCKQEVARNVSLGPVADRQQREFEQLAEENRRLREEVEKWRAAYNNRAAAPPATPAPVPARVAPVSIPALAPPTETAAANPVPIRPAVAAPAARTHTIKSGETPSRIAREYGIRLDTLMAANPGLDARRLQPGQAMAIPLQ